MPIGGSDESGAVVRFERRRDMVIEDNNSTKNVDRSHEAERSGEGTLPYAAWAC